MQFMPIDYDKPNWHLCIFFIFMTDHKHCKHFIDRSVKLLKIIVNPNVNQWLGLFFCLLFLCDMIKIQQIYYTYSRKTCIIFFLFQRHYICVCLCFYFFQLFIWCTSILFAHVLPQLFITIPEILKTPQHNTTETKCLFAFGTMPLFCFRRPTNREKKLTFFSSFCLIYTRRRFVENTKTLKDSTFIYRIVFTWFWDEFCETHLSSCHNLLKHTQKCMIHTASIVQSFN